MLQDADHKPPADTAAPPAQELVQIQLPFVHPPGFRPVAFLIIAMDEKGQTYTNAPTPQPAVMLHLATKGLDFASQQVILKLQAEKQSSIVQAPPGLTIPPWKGPEGRG